MPGSAPAELPPRWLSLRNSRGYTLFVVSYSVFVDIFLYGVIVPIMPFVLQSRLGVPPTNIQHWVSVLLTVYGVSLLGGALAIGWWTDQISIRRWPFLSGLALLAGSTLILCLARNITMLIIGRMLQGISAAVVWTVATVILTDRIGADELGAAMGWVGAARSAAIVTGPLLGGIVYQRAGYYSVYGMVFATIIFDAAFRLALIEPKVAVKWEPTIWRVSNNSSADGHEETHLRQGAEMMPTPNSKGIEVPATVSDLQLNPSTKSTSKSRSLRLPPMITLIKRPRIAIALWGCFFQAVLICGFDATLPIFVKRTFHWTPQGAGLIFLAIVVPSFVSPLIGWASDKHGAKWYSVFGYLACAPPIVCLMLVDHDGISQVVLLVALLALTGLFCLFFNIPLWAEIIRSVEDATKANPEDFGKNGATGQAYGLTNFFFALGVIVGPLWAGFTYQEAGWRTMAWTMGMVSGLTAIPSALWTGGYLFEKAKGSRKPGGVDGEEEMGEIPAKVAAVLVEPALASVANKCS